MIISKRTTYSVCPKETSYAGNGNCCPAGTYLNTKGYCQGNSSTSGNTTPTYNLTTPSVSSGSSSTGSSGSNCITSGTVVYQACKMAAEGITNNGQYYLTENECCGPEVAAPTLEPIK